MRRGTNGLAPLALLGAAAVATLDGCATTETLPPAAPMTESSLGLSATPAPPVDRHWWRAFGDPQLDALVERATRGSPTFAEALARVARAQADQRIAASARGLQVNGAAEVLRAYYAAGDFPLPAAFASGSAWASVVDFGVNWNLDFWGRQRDLVQAAAQRADAGALDARGAELALEGSVVTAYLELDRDHALAELAAEVERNRTQLAELTGRRTRAGLETDVELRTAAARIPEVRVDRNQAQARIALAVHALAALCGEGAGAYADIHRPQLARAAALALPASLPGDLLMRRPDVAAGLARIKGASSSQEAARLAAYPDIELSGIAGLAALSLPDLLTHPGHALGAGPALHLPIFDAGRIRAEQRAAHADLELAVATYDATVVEAVRQVADQLATLAALDVVVDDEERNLALLTDAAHLAVERFSGGLTTRQPVLEAEARLLTVRSALINSRALAAEGRVALLVAVGGSTEPIVARAAAAPSAP